MTTAHTATHRTAHTEEHDMPDTTAPATTVHLTQSGGMPLFNGLAALPWGTPAHVDALRTVWATLTPLAQNMARETFPAAVALIEDDTETTTTAVPTAMVDDVTRAFLTAGLWADLYDVTEAGVFDIADDGADVDHDDIVGVGDAWSLVQGFLIGLASQADELEGNARASWDYVDANRDQAGHDLWLTANGHGAGFWDRGLGDVGVYLTALARPYGDLSLTRDTDGVVRFEG